LINKHLLQLCAEPEWKTQKSAVCHYVSENTGSYEFLAKKRQNCNELINKCLAKICRQQQRKRGVPDLYDSAIMLMKTHIEKLSETGFAIMCMKTQVLIFSCHYVIENKGCYGKACYYFRYL